MFKGCIGLHRQTFITIYVTNTHVYLISLYLMNGCFTDIGQYWMLRMIIVLALMFRLILIFKNTNVKTRDAHN